MERNKNKEKQKIMETPRTDEHLRMKRENGHVVIVSIEFARQLEIELAAAIAELKKLKEKMRKKESDKVTNGFLFCHSPL